MRGIIELAGKKAHKYVRLPAVFLIASALLIAGGAAYVQAETYPGGEDNGKTSRIKHLSDELASLNYGSTSNSPDWGASWNRIYTSATWVPSSDITSNDVVTGKKFYNNSRTEQTGTRKVAGPCSTQEWQDNYTGANQADNCAPEWEVASPAVPGDDKQDPITEIVWSKCLVNTEGVNNFSTNNSCSTYSWDNSHANNNSSTAIELCSDRGNGWRLPTQKELMEAYVNGSYFNFGAQSNFNWSATKRSEPYAIFVSLDHGTTNATSNLSNAYLVRCVR